MSHMHEPQRATGREDSKKHAASLPVTERHTHLDEADQALLRRIAVFSGPMSLDAVAAITDPDGMFDVHGGVERLIELDLLQPIPEPKGEARYAMPGAVRRFALERLDQAGEAHSLGGRHAAHFLALAEGAEQALTGPHRAEVMERLRDDMTNLALALEWSIACDPPMALRLTTALFHFWYYDDPLEGTAWTLRALDADNHSDPRARSRALVRAAAFASSRSAHSEMVALCSEALALAEAGNDDAVRGWATIGMADAAWFMDEDPLLAETRFVEAERLLRSSGERWAAQRVMSFRGEMVERLGSPETARLHRERALVAARELGDSSMECWELVSMARAALAENDLERAAASIEDAVELGRSSGCSRIPVIFALCAEGEISHALGDVVSSAATASEIEHMMSGVHDRLWRMWALDAFADLCLSTGDTARAVDLMHEAVAQIHPEDSPWMQATWRLRLGCILRADAKAAAAAASHAEAVRIATAAGRWPLAGRSIVGLADVAADLGLEDRARALRAAAETVRTVSESTASRQRREDAIAEALQAATEMATSWESA